MDLLEYLAVGLFYLPLIATPLLIVYWSAFVTTRMNEHEQDANEPHNERNEHYMSGTPRSGSAAR